MYVHLVLARMHEVNLALSKTKSFKLRASVVQLQPLAPFWNK